MECIGRGKTVYVDTLFVGQVRELFFQDKRAQAGLRGESTQRAYSMFLHERSERIIVSCRGRGRVVQKQSAVCGKLGPELRIGWQRRGKAQRCDPLRADTYGSRA